MINLYDLGQELFDGVIHPAAGLFEDYFDVDKAAEEHQGYISMLKNNGIKVVTVADILNEVGIDSLRTLASNVLTYDISGLNEPDEEMSENDRQYVLSRMSRADLVKSLGACIVEELVAVYLFGQRGAVEQVGMESQHQSVQHK